MHKFIGLGSDYTSEVRAFTADVLNMHRPDAITVEFRIERLNIRRVLKILDRMSDAINFLPQRYKTIAHVGGRAILILQYFLWQHCSTSLCLKTVRRSRTWFLQKKN